MMSRRFLNGCSESRLRSYLDDRLAEPEECQLADHLARCEKCRQTLERLAAGSRICAELRGLTAELHPLSKAAERIAPDFLGPSELPGFLGSVGPYEVAEVLGRGGFGVVFRAHDPTLGRTVAVKVLAPQLAACAAARSRFAREAKAAAAVVHENVVAIHVVDSWNGLPYLVMACVGGGSLQERVDRKGPLAVKEVLRIGMQTALGLAAAHDQGLIHRDIKPSNILLENGVERVKLSDFGLARAVDDASQTQSGVIAGTPQYMSPEQARGDPVDHRSDLFSLGGVMYFMCAGRPPFRADSTPAVLRRVCDDQPRPLREINPDVPEWLAEVIDRLLVKDAAGRCATATEVAEVLKHHLANLQRTGTSARLGPIPKSPVRKRSARRPVAAVLLTSMVLIAAIIGGYSLIPSGDETSRSVSDDPASAPIVGSGNPDSKSWDIADFTRVEIRSAFRAEITKGDTFKVIVSSDDNAIEHIQIIKKAKTLRIGLDHNRKFRLKEPLTAKIMLPALDGLELNGGSKATLNGFRSDGKFKVAISGGSTLDGTIGVGITDFQVSGGSAVDLRGSAKAADFTVSGGSIVKLPGFAMERCTIDLSGGAIALIALRSDQPFRATLSGRSFLEGSVEVKNIELIVTRAARAKLNGSAQSANIFASASDKVDLTDLIVDEAEISLPGSSWVVVGVRKRLAYKLSTDAKLEYSGDPSDLTGSKSSGATLRRLP